MARKYPFGGRSGYGELSLIPQHRRTAHGDGAGSGQRASLVDREGATADFFSGAGSALWEAGRVPFWPQLNNEHRIRRTDTTLACIGMGAFSICCRLVAICLIYGLTMEIADAGAAAQLTGIAFVDSSVTSQGSRAQLPAGAKIYPPDSEINGSEGYPTTPYRTDGLIVAIIDYDGEPTAASLAVIRHPASGGRFENAPYYLDLDAGRTLQYLGPIFDNGTYEMHLTWGIGQAQDKATSAEFVLARNCP